jgi:hypothetical protein
MRSRLWHLVAIAISVTMSCHDRSGLVLPSNMPEDVLERVGALPSVTFQLQGQGDFAACDYTSLTPEAAGESAKKRQNLGSWRLAF